MTDAGIPLGFYGTKDNPGTKRVMNRPWVPVEFLLQVLHSLCGLRAAIGTFGVRENWAEEHVCGNSSPLLIIRTGSRRHSLPNMCSSACSASRLADCSRSLQGVHDAGECLVKEWPVQKL